MKLSSTIVAVLCSYTLTARSAGTAVLQTLDGLSQCALNCTTSILLPAKCSQTDAACICADTKTQAAIAGCIASSCTVKETLTARNTTATICHEPTRNEYKSLQAINIAMMVISGVFVASRIGHKLAMARNSRFGLDDLFIVLTFLILLPNTICVAVELLPNGLGRDIWTVPFDHITEYLKFFYWGELIYLATLPVLKMSFLFFYKRIFPAQTIQRLIIATIVFNAVWGVSIVLVAVFACTPISYFWHQWDHEHQGHCISIGAMNWANASMSIALDLWMLALPLSQLVHLRLSPVKKGGVVLMFCLGALATLIAIIRLKFLAIVTRTNNPTWDQRNLIKWSNIEIAVGVVCACLPSVRIILVRFLPNVFGSTHQNTQQNQHGATHNRASNYAQFSSKSEHEKEEHANQSHRTTTVSLRDNANDDDVNDDDEVELVDIGNHVRVK